MSKYTSSTEWSDIEPIPQDDGPGQPLAAIAYTDAYSEAMSYLRAVMAKNEMSERVLGLTEDVIGMNPAHYTVWLYRARVLFMINTESSEGIAGGIKEDALRQEIAWLNPIALRHQKNYQIWHHRQLIIDKLDSYEGEQNFISQMFELDSKNYHVWSYRQWLVQRFGLWDSGSSENGTTGGSGELQYVEDLLKQDVRNNSAWNHRWFIVFGQDEKRFEDEKTVEREYEYTKSKIHLAPQNQSPWNYLQGLARKAPTVLTPSTLKSFAAEFASLDDPDHVRSSHALDMLANIYAKEEGNKENAVKALDLLAKKYDPVRENYWNYRKSLVAGQEVKGTV